MHNFHDKEKKKLLVFPKSLLDLQIQNFFLLYKYKICLAMFSKIPVQFTFLNRLPIQRVVHSSVDQWPPMAFPVQFVLLNRLPIERVAHFSPFSMLRKVTQFWAWLCNSKPSTIRPNSQLPALRRMRLLKPLLSLVFLTQIIMMD